MISLPYRLLAAACTRAWPLGAGSGLADLSVATVAGAISCRAAWEGGLLRYRCFGSVLASGVKYEPSTALTLSKCLCPLLGVQGFQSGMDPSHRRASGTVRFVFRFGHFFLVSHKLVGQRSLELVLAETPAARSSKQVSTNARCWVGLRRDHHLSTSKR